jgi:hypothetical protein
MLYRWTTHKTAMAYIVSQVVSIFDNNDILREDKIPNIVRLLNNKSQFVRTPITNVRFF